MPARCHADTLHMNRLELQLLAAMSGVTDGRLWDVATGQATGRRDSIDRERDGAARDARHAERRT